MVKGGRKKKKMPANPISVESEKELVRIENETLRIVSNSLTELEIAISSWEASKEQPEELEEKFRRYKWFHQALSEWAKKMLKYKKTKPVDMRIPLLREYVRICKAYGEI